MQQIEYQKHQLAFIRLTRAHLRHQAVKMRSAAGIDLDQLGVEDGRLRGQLAEGFGHAPQPVRVFSAVA
jgi:hypothetical protein